ncbi:GNAT family N-acetyltransferase [Colwellia sp. 1_MG-2023]|uniref:GNAT family N-acetyltransferase n=1 Tax=Colwellia sp. 1_MG-2023 TaxID=3062649 RepID=UPI0026E2ABF0|nr:GNAT family N-acetyltransferase [Colwellia sp. 1_MG-2023]MDO6445120.1 GNAT family N-acetyltransferase [Colwellia sp. 1_MG-2023]
MTINIRKYQTHDLKGLLIVWEKSSRLAHPFMANSFFEQERDNIPNIYIPNTDTQVITVDGVVVGFIALIEGENSGVKNCEIGGLFVDPNYHGQKLGKALVDFAVDKYGPLTVKVLKENHLGRSFYNKYGFAFMREITWEPTGDILIELKC